MATRLAVFKMVADRAGPYYSLFFAPSVVLAILAITTRRRRGLQADHATVWRWVLRYGPELEQRMRRHLKPSNNETYVRVQGRWCYLYRAIDSAGATIDFLLFRHCATPMQPNDRFAKR